MNAKTAAMRHIADEGEEEEEEEEKKDKDGVIAVKDDPQFTLAITRGKVVPPYYIRLQVFTCSINVSDQ